MRIVFACLALLCCSAVWAQEVPEPVQDFSNEAFFGNTSDEVRRATPADQLRVPAGFKAELLYTVPLDEQGSWVCLTTDAKGRLIASAQWGGLYRITAPPIDGDASGIHVEPLEVEIGSAQGLLCAHNSLYVVKSAEDDAGLYRVTDTDGDDQYDAVKLLRRFTGDGEHGPHAVILSPDGNSLYIVGGNGCYLDPAPERSLVPPVWREDRLLERIGASDGEFEIERPGAWVCRTDPEGQSFELVAMGMRNPYDIAFSPEGELFTFDSDMEWDEGTPWYRPTRVNHVVSGADFGWRAGTAKWPDDYLDSAGSVIDIGFSSPTGITFGTGARFPAKYQRALFLCDWSLGYIYAVHLTSDGASYVGEAEHFLAGAPLPVTDVIIHPTDGAMYFTTGGRGITSALYRVTYVGDESVDPVRWSADANTDLRAVRHKLETFHGRVDSAAIRFAWPHLAHEDRSIRYAARIAIESQPMETWQDRALEEPLPRSRIAALVTLARHADERLHGRIAMALGELNWSGLSHEDRLDLLRAHMIALARSGDPEPEVRRRILGQLDELFPSGESRVDRELAEILSFLQAPQITARLLRALEAGSTQEEQIHYAMCLRAVEEGWTDERLRQYLAWFNQAAGQGGGVSFSEYIAQMREQVVSGLSAAQKTALREVLENPPVVDPYAQLKQREFVKQWTVIELLRVLDANGAAGDVERGQKVFAAAACYRCHRFHGQGGVTGPDLSGVARRFQTRDILEAIIDPSRVVSDQYRAVQVVMNDGRVVSGKIRDQSGNVLLLMKDPANPADLAIVQRDAIDELAWSPVSLMPNGLLDTFSAQEIVDLFAFLKNAPGEH